MTTIERLTKHVITATPAPVMPSQRCAHEGCDRAGKWYTNQGRAAGRYCDRHYCELMGTIETKGETR